MNLEYKNKQLFFGDASLKDLAQTYQTPVYVYSGEQIQQNFDNFARALDAEKLNSTICYAVKANSNLSILKLLDAKGAGFDIVSMGELQRILAAGAKADKVVFSGVGKTYAELKFALEQNIKCINIESLAEIDRLQEVSASLNAKAKIAIRLNPNIDAKTHPYISTGLKENKFGIDMDFIAELIEKLRQAKNLELLGLAFHLGSQISQTSPFEQALEKIEKTWDYFMQQGFNLQHLDIGGGFGIKYKDEKVFDFAAFLQKISPSLKAKVAEFIIAPGRAMLADAGVLLAKIEYLKNTSAKNFAILDTSMNDLVRPSLYSAWHNILEVEQRDKTPSQTYDVVGSICETGDFLGKQRELRIEAGDYLAITHAGAYGFSMASNYNSRLMPAEVLLTEGDAKLIRKRQTYADLYNLELEQ